MDARISAYLAPATNPKSCPLPAAGRNGRVVAFLPVQKVAGDQKLIILGIDGMDPQLLKKFMAEGKMPNFSALAQKGSFRLLTTSIPPQSPVAWSNLITGMNAGGHGIFDFIHRDPKTLQPYFSASRVEPPRHAIHLGNWVIPIGSGTAEQLRQGKAFWETLDDLWRPQHDLSHAVEFPSGQNQRAFFVRDGHA